MCSSGAVKAISNAVKDLGGKAFQATPDLNDEFGLGLGGYLDPHIASKDAYNRYQDDQKNKDTDEEEAPEFNEEEAPELELGSLASGRRIQGQGQGIGANILTSGSGVKSKAKTRKKTLLG